MSRQENDAVASPAHYTSGDIEAKDALKAAMDGSELSPMAFYWWGCAFKYLWRWPRKNGVEDLPKRCEYSGYGKKEVDWRGIIGEEVENRVGAIIDENGDEIVEMAVKRVYDSIIRRKPFREACKKMDIIFDGIGGDSDD